VSDWTDRQTHIGLIAAPGPLIKVAGKSGASQFCCHGLLL